MPTTYEPIATTTLGSAVTTFSFTSIPATFTDLVVVISAPGITGGTSMDSDMRFNADAGGNYGHVRWQNAGTDRGTSLTYIPIGAPRSDTRHISVINIFNYSNTTTFKPVLARTSFGGSDSVVEAYSGLWRSTSAINQITFISGQSRNYNTGTMATIYGIKAAT